MKRTSSNTNYKVYIETSTDNEKWEARKTYAMSDFGNGSYTSKTDDTFDGETALYVRFHCYNTTAVRYVDDVVINYKDEKITYSGYCTTVEPQTQTVDISAVGYATACIPFNATVDGATAYYVTIDGETATLNEIEGTIPAETGVILKGAEGTVTFTESAETLANVDGNCLEGTVVEGGKDFTDGTNEYYIFANDDNYGGLGFYRKVTDKGTHCAQYKAVLAVPAGLATAKSFFLFDETVGIEAIHNSQCRMQNTQYNLNGMRVNGNYKGIVIINGKKVIK